MSDLALEIVGSIPRREDSDYVFTTTGRTPISGFSRAKTLIDAIIAKGRGARQALGLPRSFEENWRFHDLRRTVATRLEDNLGVAKPLISAILNHAEAGATAVYTKGQLREQKFLAMQTWGKYLTNLFADVETRVHLSSNRSV